MNFFRYFIILGLVWTSGFSLYGQSNELIDSFLAGEEADVQNTILLLGQSLGTITEDGNSAEALAWSQDQEWYRYIKELQPDNPISLGAFSAVLLECYEIPGKSLMYCLFKTPRYAAMEAYSLGYITQNLYHTRYIKPTEVLYALAMAMEASNE